MGIWVLVILGGVLDLFVCWVFGLVVFIVTVVWVCLLLWLVVVLLLDSCFVFALLHCC